MLAPSRLGAPIVPLAKPMRYDVLSEKKNIYIYIYKYHRSTYVAFVMKVHGSRGDEDASAAVPASLLHSRSSAPSAHFSG